MTSESDREPRVFARYVKAALAVGLVIVLALLVWRLTFVLILVFSSVVVASILLIASDFVERVTPLRSPWSKVLAWLLLALLTIGFFFLFGTQMAAQFTMLGKELPGMIDEVGSLLGIHDLQGLLAERMEALAGQDGLVGDLADYTRSVLGTLSMLLLVVVAGVFLAIDPDGYRRGLLEYVPDPHRERLDTALVFAGKALRLWLVGKLLTMVAIGVITTAGLYALGVPSAFALGIIAGVLEFVPFIGPILSAVPALLVAVPEGMTMVLWVAGLYFVIQLLENNLLVPLIQQQTVDLSPALGLFALVAFTVLFGLSGMLLGIPLTVVLLVLVKKLYVRDALGRETHLPGEKPGA